MLLRTATIGDLDRAYGVAPAAATPAPTDATSNGAPAAAVVPPASVRPRQGNATGETP